MLRRNVVRRLTSAITGSGKIGSVHPDAMGGINKNSDYAGPGWLGTLKILPISSLMAEGGFSGGSAGTYDRIGPVMDPEDPRHEMVTIHSSPIGLFTEDLSANFIAQGNFGPVPEGSKLLSVLYENYLEPFSMNRVAIHLGQWDKVPNNHHLSLDATCDYIGQTANLIGDVTIATGSVVMEGVTIRADANAVYIGEGCQILENVSIIADAPAILHHYQRREQLNPYQVYEAMEGVVKIGQNTIVEPNCHIESCIIGPYNRIGHGSHIMKGVQTGTISHILPGSVVVQDTKIGDGEVWGGAPAKKLGKVSKYEYKRPYFASLLHREAVVEGLAETNRYGSQMVEFAADCELIDDLVVEYESEVTPAVRAQVRQLIEGREPFEHTVCRTLQVWSAAGRTDNYQGARGPFGVGVACPFPDRAWWMRPGADAEANFGPTGSICPLWAFASGNWIRQT